jgi:hypothetical protein
MMIVSTIPVVIAQTASQGHEKDGNKKFKAAVKKIKHDKKLLKEGIEENNKAKKEAAKKSFEDAADLVGQAKSSYEKAKENASIEYKNKPTSLKKILARLDARIATCDDTTKRLGAAIQIVDIIIKLEGLPGTINTTTAEDELFDAIASIFSGKDPTRYFIKATNILKLLWEDYPELFDLINQIIKEIEIIMFTYHF